MKVEVRLFGRPEATADGGVILFRPERRYQLLAWLALQAAPVDRDRIAGLFWPDRDNATARRNLRKLVFDAQTFAWANELGGDRTRLWWQPASDVAAFEAALAARRPGEAVCLYRGPLCDGLEDAGNREFAEALAFERKRFADQWRGALLGLLARVGLDPEEGLQLAYRLAAADAFDEEAVAAAMRALVALGRPAEAQRLFRDFALRLGGALGVEPSVRLRELARGLPQPHVVQAPAPIHPSFIGRLAELQELRALLARAECRVLTVTGPGGIGKSRLVKAALSSLEPHFPDGTWWIALDDLLDEAAVASRLAQALGVDPAGRPALDAVATLLVARTSLLVLDNAESVASLGASIGRLLARAPRLKVLVTSRRRLAVSGEWLLPLPGLPVPSPRADDAQAADCDAVRLFVMWARIAHPPFDAARELAAVASLVRRLGGLPLAIELAAHWVRLMPIAQIEEEVARSLEVLERDDEGDERPEHRSVQATFESSWRLLAPAEQRTLSLLSLFVGSFSRAAAREVAGMSLPLLAALHDKSLLQSEPESRLSLHPLVQQFARAKLDVLPASEVGAARERHLEFFARLLEGTGSTRAGWGTRDLGDDLSNVQVAWRYAVECAAPALARLTPPLVDWFNRRGGWRELEALVAPALAALDHEQPANRRAVARLLQARAVLLAREGRFEETIDTAREALQRARSLRDRVAMRASLSLIGSSMLSLGRRRQGRRYLEQALAHARADRDVADIASYTNNLATIEKQLGHYERALLLYQESLALKRQLGEMRGVAVALHNLGNLYRAQQQWERAVPFLEEGLHVCDQFELRSVRPSLASNLGATLLQLGRTGEADRLLARALEEVRDSGERHIEAFIRLNRVKSALARDDERGAGAELHAAIALAQAMGSAPYLLECLMAHAMLLQHQGERERAGTLCHFVARDEATNEADRVVALQQMDDLALDGDQNRRAIDAAGAIPDLASAIAASLAALAPAAAAPP